MVKNFLSALIIFKKVESSTVFAATRSTVAMVLSAYIISALQITSSFITGASSDSGGSTAFIITPDGSSEAGTSVETSSFITS